MSPRIYSPISVLLIILAILVPLAVSTYYINFWPTDSQNPYIPVAAKLFQMDNISQIHDLNLQSVLRVNMRAKEALILGIAIMQKILGDPASLYPNILLLIMAFGVSCWLIYLIIRHYFDERIAFITFVLFAGCQWTYLYILQGAHQPLALMNFLLAVYFLTLTKQHKWFYTLSGLFVGVMFFSSPTAILFGPYYLGVLIYNERNVIRNYRNIVVKAAYILAGALAGYLFFTWPHPIGFIEKYIEYINWSRYGNNFTIYRNFLPQLFPLTPNFRGEGWIWIFKYGFLIMPVLFPFYIGSLIYIFKKSFKNYLYIFVFFLSLSTPILVEIIKVVQFGRNYFTWIIGIIGIIPFVLYEYAKDEHRPHSSMRTLTPYAIWTIIILHIGCNAYTFLTNIFPARMSTTNVYQWCRANDVSKLHIYYEHPLEKNTVMFMNNPKFDTPIDFERFQTIKDVQSGYILIPPLSGKTLFLECRMDHFLLDPYLTELMFSGSLEKFVVKKFRTMANSRLWNMEEEICAHRDLTLGQISQEDRNKGYIYLLDAEKLQKEWFTQN